jgi:thiol-disulfide isomerase/thioredoxin
MTSRNPPELEWLRANAAEIAELPPEDPLVRALEREDGEQAHFARGAADAERLRAALADVEVPVLEPALLALPDRDGLRSTRAWKLATLVAIAAAAVFAGLWLAGPEPRPAAPGAVEPAAAGAELVAVKFWHRTCPACREIDPRYGEVQRRLEGQPLLFVTFDMSTEESRRQSEMLADRLGLGDHYRENFGSSGFVILVDPKTGREVGRLTTRDDIDGMTDIVESRLARPRS